MTIRTDTPSLSNPTLKVSELDEHALIERIKAAAPNPFTEIPIGIGDDAAVIESESGTLTAVTTDTLVEGVHFELNFSKPFDIGHKALAINLSDLAAMGATPRYFVLSLGLPSMFLLRDFDALLSGLLELSTRYRVNLIGGNVTRSSGPLFIDITAFGGVKRRRILTRHTARVGDELYVSGTIGSAAAGLTWLQQHTPKQLTSEHLAKCRQQYLRPEPRVRLGTLLGKNRITHTCIDLSDGLAEGVRQLASTSGLGVIINAAALPIEPEARTWFERQKFDPVIRSLKGGDDYELLFTVPPNSGRNLAAIQRLVKDLPLTSIGYITKEPSLVLRRNGRNEQLPQGYQHFRETSD